MKEVIVLLEMAVNRKQEVIVHKVKAISHMALEEVVNHKVVVIQEAMFSHMVVTIQEVMFIHMEVATLVV